jgi:hypothetical protein
MFAPGSNLTKVLVEVTASDESGIFDYTVDAIKYVDGTDIKGVRMEGEKTIKTAIRYDEEPTIQDINQSVGTKSLNLNLFASNPNGLIGENLFTFYLSNGIDIIYEKDLVKGANQVELNNLLLNKAYQYAVKAVYDVYDGKGLVEKTLVKEEFSTLKGLLIRNVEVGQEEVSFDFNKVEDSATIIKVTKQDLFKISKKEEFHKYSKNY